MGKCFSKDKTKHHQTHQLDSPQQKHPKDQIEKSQDTSKLDECITSTTDIRKIYKFDPQIIGKGHFGAVRLAVLQNNPNKLFAVKTISKQKIQKDLHLLKRELEILKSLDHPNIIKFYETYQDDKFFHFVMEYCSGGELLQRIIEKGQLSEQEAMNIMKKVFSAVNHLHKSNICHRDLKLENILFVDKSQDSDIKLIDFGLSKKFGENETKALTTMVGTALYVAPEVLKGDYDEKCDAWGLGVLTYILLSGSPPFIGENNQEIFKKVAKGKFSMSGAIWKKISKNAKDLIENLIVIDPKKRLSVSEALNHKWFTQDIAETDRVEVDLNVIQRLRDFKSMHKFQKEVLRVIINFLSEDELKNMKNSFQQMDIMHTGFITNQDFMIIVKEFNLEISQEEIQQILNQLKLDSEIGINYSEFLTAALDRNLFLTDEKLMSAFKYFDVDNSNFITKSNLKEAFIRSGKNITDSEIDSIITDIDVQKTGKISFKIFCDVMKMDKNQLQSHQNVLPDVVISQDLQENNMNLVPKDQNEQDKESLKIIINKENSNNLIQSGVYDIPEENTTKQMHTLKDLDSIKKSISQIEGKTS